MQRLEALNKLRFHPWYSNLMGRLRPEQEKEIVNFIKQNDGLDRVEFARLVNGLRGASKFQLLMAELLTVVNNQGAQ